MTRILRLTAIAVAAILARASAHLEPGSLSTPAAGQAFSVGSQVVLTWVQAEFHQGRYALSWSSDGGTTWRPIADWSGPGGDNVTVKYSWTVPDAPGSATRVRICQLGVCDDPDYRLESGNFTITPAAAARPAVPASGSSLRFHPDRCRLEVSFALDRPESVILEAFDLQGGRVDAWLGGVHAAGTHAYSLDAGGLGSGGPRLLRLLMGNKIAAQAILPSP